MRPRGLVMESTSGEIAAKGEDLIARIWVGLAGAGFPEVMLYLADGTASRCHWDDTTVIEGERVALVADQDRGIVRIIPVGNCKGIGLSAPKGSDPSAYKPTVMSRIRACVDREPAPVG